jgi:penicillin-binding protein 1A
VYATAILNGYSPCLKVPNVPVIFPEFDNWQPKNNDGIYGDVLTLEQGLARSVNCVTAYLIKQVGPEAVVELAKKMGITSKVDPYPSISLGSADISVYEMVGAFNTFNNSGVWVEPVYILRIEDKDGNVLKEFVPREVEVMDEKYNFVMLNMLMKTSTIKNGTALRLRGSKYNFRNQVACKTGTTQNQSDGWFIGLVPQLSAGCWVGGEERSIHFRSTYLGQGANMALPIWALFMNKVYNDKTLGIDRRNFEVPKEELPVEIDCSKYLDESTQSNFNGE